MRRSLEACCHTALLDSSTKLTEAFSAGYRDAWLQQVRATCGPAAVRAAAAAIGAHGRLVTPSYYPNRCPRTQLTTAADH